MALRKIENIKIGEFPAGTAFGAYVYNANISVGMNGEPSTLEVDLVNESGIYNINKSALDAVSSRSVKFGNLSSANPKDFVFIKSMFLVNFSYNQGVGQKTLRLKFVDGASVLEKIQVVLLNKQANPNNIHGRWFGVWQDAVREYSVPIQCNNKCDELQAPPWGTDSRNPWPTGHFRSFGHVKGQGRSGKSVVIVRQANQAMVTNVDPSNLAHGGVIILGESEFTSSLCQIPNVTYTFAQLISVIENFLGIPVIGLSDRNLPTREAFTGSLKEVLNNWCGLYGYSFGWDYNTNSIYGIDLQNPNLTSLEPIYQLVHSTKEGSTETPVAISDVNRDFSIENTYNQDHISNFVKPAKTAQFREKISRRELFRPFNIFNLIPKADFENIVRGRTPEEFLISCALSRFSVEARTLYNYHLIANKTNGFQNNVSTYGAPLGLSIKQLLSADDKTKLLNFTMSIEASQANNKKYGLGAGIALGTYSKELEDKWIDWEKGIADFLGKYYYRPQTMTDTFICNKTQQMKYIREVTTLPDSKIITRGEASTSEEFPFNSLLLHPMGIQSMQLMHNGVQMNNFHLFSRDPSYGMNGQDFSEMFIEDGENVLKDYLPSFAELDGNQRLFLGHLLRRGFPTIWNNLEALENEDKRPKLLFLPTAAKITSVLNISALQGTAGWSWTFDPPDGLGQNPYSAAPGNVINTKEFKAEDKEEKKTCEKMVCETDLISWLCGCPAGDQYDPDNVGLTNKSAQWFKVSVNKPSTGVDSKSVIFPSEYPMSGYVNVLQEVTRTVQGIMQHFGLLTNAKGTMGYKVSTRSITSDMDAIEDASKSGVPSGPGEESGQIKSHVMLPGHGRLAASIYHNLTNTAHRSGFVNETLSFTMMGLDFGAFYSYITPLNGLRSMSIALGEDGTRVSASLSTAPPVSPQLDSLLPKIETRLNSNLYHRTY